MHLSGTFVLILLALAVAIGLSLSFGHAEAASMTFSSNTTIGPGEHEQTIGTGEIWQVDPGVTLTLSSATRLDNFGTIINNGTIINLDEINNFGIIINDYGATIDSGVASDLSNSYIGTVTNHGTINI